MRQAILDFSSQLRADLEVVNVDRLIKSDKFILCGLGGSALAAGLFKVYRPTFDLLIHRDYGLPRVPRYFLEGSLLILSSYSGNTEEVLDTLKLALARGLKLAVVASGGELLAQAKQLRLPYVVLSSGLPPRLAVGAAFAALARLFRDNGALAELTQLARSFQPAIYEVTGETLAKSVGDKLPIIYSSTVNYFLAYNWKIRLNETGKIPAFCNILPEMNHNELEVLDPNFFYILLRDESDQPRIQRRFAILAEMLKARGGLFEEVQLAGSPLEKIFRSVSLADWTAYHLALAAGRDPIATPLVEEFKKRLSS